MIVLRIQNNARETVETVPYGNPAVARIDELSGRSIGAYILTKALPYGARRRGRESAYVQAARGSEWRERFGSQGFHVEVVRDA